MKKKKKKKKRGGVHGKLEQIQNLCDQGTCVAYRNILNGDSAGLAPNLHESKGLTLTHCMIKKSQNPWVSSDPTRPIKDLIGPVMTHGPCLQTKNLIKNRHATCQS